MKIPLSILGYALKAVILYFLFNILAPIFGVAHLLYPQYLLLLGLDLVTTLFAIAMMLAIVGLLVVISGINTKKVTEYED